MPADRTQLAHERIDAIAEVLVQEGLLEEDWKDALSSEQIDQIGEAPERARARGRGEGPPDHAGGGG